MSEFGLRRLSRPAAAAAGSTLIALAALIALATLGGAPAARADAADDYATPPAFRTLYQDFPSSYAPDSIGAMLGSTMQIESGAGPLVLATDTNLYVYDADSRAKLADASFRLAPNSGFVELTALSHVGPAVAYLAKLKELGRPGWRETLDRLITHIREVRAVNAATEDHWLDRMAQPAFGPNTDAIKALFDYGCWMAGSYLVSVREKDGDGFTTASVGTDFLAASGGDYPIPFNNVMVGTFILAALTGQYAIHEAIEQAEIDWRDARVVIRAVPGTNYTSSLTKGTQALFPLIHNLSGQAFDEDRILIVPFADIRPTVGAETMSEDDFGYYTAFIWQQAYSRRQIAPVAFPGVETIFLPDRAALPGDYGVTGPDDIDDFMIRMKHSFADPREALSNTVAFWIAGELFAKDWDPARLDLPGVTHGFPEGVSGYPANNPPF